MPPKDGVLVKTQETDNGPTIHLDENNITTGKWVTTKDNWTRHWYLKRRRDKYHIMDSMGQYKKETRWLQW